MKVSAIVSTYNSADHFSGCLDDLLQQSLYQQGLLEIIIINSGSLQNEDEIVQPYLNQYPNIVYQKTERETLYAAWNRGVALANGVYITNANTDDRHRYDAFEKLSEALDSNPQVALAYGDILITEKPNESFAVNSAQSCYILPECSVRQALCRQFFGPHPMWRKSIHDQIGFFNPEFVVSGDYDFFIRVVVAGGGLHIPEFLSLYCRRHDSVERANKSKNAIEEDSVIRRYRTQTDFSLIYPDLETISQQPEKLAAAYNDFAVLCASSIPTLDIAIAYAQKALAASDTQPEIFNNIAVLLARHQMFEEAARIFQMLQQIQHPVLQHNFKVISTAPIQPEHLQLLEIKNEFLQTLTPVFIGNLERSLAEGSLLQAQLKKSSPLRNFNRALSFINSGHYHHAQSYYDKYKSAVQYNTFSLLDRRNIDKPAITIAIVAYKTGEHLLACLQSVFAQTMQNFEVMVIDNGGNESVLESVCSYPLLYVNPGINMNPSEGRNIAAYFSKSNILYFVDDDALVAPKSAEAIISAFAALPDVLALRGRVLPKQDLPYNRHAGHYNLGDERILISYADTEGNTAIRLSAYKELSGMNPLLFGGEGFEMSYRIYQKFGFGKILYDPNVIIYHDYADSDQKMEHKSLRHNRMKEYLNYLHPGIEPFRQIQAARITST